MSDAKKQESRIPPALSSMHPQIHTPISIYNILYSQKKCKILNIFLYNIYP